MKYIMAPRRVTLLIYGDEDSPNYTASCQININGSYATLDTLIGPDFYKFLSEHGFAPFKELGIKHVGAIVTVAHSKLILRRLKTIDSIEVEMVGPPEESIGGAQLCLITFKEKSPQTTTA